MSDYHMVDFYEHELDADAKRQLMAILQSQMEDPETEIPIPLDSPLGKVIMDRHEECE